MQDEKLARFEAAFEVAAVKKFAGERAGVVLHQKMIDGIAAAHAANGLSAGDAYAEGENVVGADVLDLREVDAVFVAEREIGEEIFEGVDAAFGEEFGTLRAYTFDHLDVGLQAIGHRDVYIIFVVAGIRVGRSEEKNQQKELHRERREKNTEVTENSGVGPFPSLIKLLFSVTLW